MNKPLLFSLMFICATAFAGDGISPQMNFPPEFNKNVNSLLAGPDDNWAEFPNTFAVSDDPKDQSPTNQWNYALTKFQLRLVCTNLDCSGGILIWRRKATVGKKP